MLKLIQRTVANERLMRRVSPLLGPLDPFSPEFRDEPSATWRRLREETPVFYSRVFGAWFVTRHADCLDLLRGSSASADRSNVMLMRAISWFNRNEVAFGGFMRRNLLMLEGDEHRRLRGLVSKAFTPRRVEALRPRLEDQAEKLCDQIEAQGEMDLVHDFAYPFPVTAIAELLGVPARDHDRFHAWTSDLVQVLDPLYGHEGAEPMRRATRALYEYFGPLLEERRAEPRDDLMSAMIQAEENGGQLEQNDLLALCTLLLVAGHETTANLIGNAVVALLRNPEQRKRLQEDPDRLLPTAVDEFLRYDSPVQLTDRALVEDVEIGGKQLKKGQLLAIAIASANRDPRQFTEPDQLDIGRSPNPHLALGQGSHFCLGSQLARLEAEIALGALLRRFPHFTGSANHVSWRRSLILRGPTELRLDLGINGGSH